MLKEGVDVSSYGDPVDWQKEARQDNTLPYRETE
jgi:GH25 family lysozyme M1 (1,4-beta-N-acetylmuramidase)